MGRLGQLQGNISTEQVNAFVQQPVEQYIVSVSGPQMKPLEQASLESLKGTTFLLSKKDKSKKRNTKMAGCSCKDPGERVHRCPRA